MVFSSYQFIFVFLPIALIGYFVLRAFTPKSTTLLWLIAVSLVFYSVWDPWNLLVLFSSIGFNFACGTLLAARSRRGVRSRGLLAAGIVFNLGLLGYFKYAGFFATNINLITGAEIPVLQLILPLAISFFTFQEIAYLIDSSRGETQGYRFKDYVLMVTFFPHLIAGPIVNHRILMRQFMSSAPLRISPQTFGLGVSLFVLGLAKKVLLADGMAPQADFVFDSVARGASPTFAESWVGALAYTLQLYFDFSGYSDMAIGLGLLFGIRLPINFNSPYQATNIVDFWRRWHMTLSAFLRDYLYISLGGSRQGRLRRNVNLMLTMLLGGLWHGAGWTFVCWGAFHGIGLVVCHFWQALFGKQQKGAISVALSRALTFIFVVFGWVIFRADSMASANTMIGAMVGFNGFEVSISGERKLMVLITLASIASLLLVTQLLPNSQQWLGYDPIRPAEDEVWSDRRRTNLLHGAALGCILTFTLTQMSAVQSFLYFQF
jgi:D-alanyl-lipoteichoic acid acyltransferase DltB (MBOAT superfamily)